MASTVSNDNDRSEKWQRPFTKGKFAAASYHFLGELSLLVLCSSPRSFSPGTPVFPSLQKTMFLFICINLLISVYSVPN